MKRARKHISFLDYLWVPGSLICASAFGALLGFAGDNLATMDFSLVVLIWMIAGGAGLIAGILWITFVNLETVPALFTAICLVLFLGSSCWWNYGPLLTGSTICAVIVGACGKQGVDWLTS